MLRMSSSTSRDRKSTRLNSSHGYISYAVFCLKKKKLPRAPSPRRHPARRRQSHRGTARPPSPHATRLDLPRKRAPIRAACRRVRRRCGGLRLPRLRLRDAAAAVRGMKIVKELVARALQRADIDAARTHRRDDFFAVQGGPLELGRDRLIVFFFYIHLGPTEIFPLPPHNTLPI